MHLRDSDNLQEKSIRRPIFCEESTIDREIMSDVVAYCVLT